MSAFIVFSWAKREVQLEKVFLLFSMIVSWISFPLKVFLIVNFLVSYFIFTYRKIRPRCCASSVMIFDQILVSILLLFWLGESKSRDAHALRQLFFFAIFIYFSLFAFWILVFEYLNRWCKHFDEWIMLMQLDELYFVCVCAYFFIRVEEDDDGLPVSF